MIAFGTLAGAALGVGLDFTARPGRADAAEVYQQFGYPFSPRHYPFDGELGNYASWRAQAHAGADMVPVPASEETDIQCIARGTVIDKSTTDNGGLGFWILVRHDNGIYSRYGHMRATSPRNIGDTVSLGTKLGVVGESGVATGVHLHLAMSATAAGTLTFSPTNSIDPIPYIRDHLGPVPLTPEDTDPMPEIVNASLVTSQPISGADYSNILFAETGGPSIGYGFDALNVNVTVRVAGLAEGERAFFRFVYFNATTNAISAFSTSEAVGDAAGNLKYVTASAAAGFTASQRLRFQGRSDATGVSVTAASWNLAGWTA